jgi:hypothetical protein
MRRSWQVEDSFLQIYFRDNTLGYWRLEIGGTPASFGIIDKSIIDK